MQDARDPVRLRLDIAYDGTAFSGWASQPGERTVQATLEGAIDQIFGRRWPGVRVVVAGRTDAGVHATGQVAHLDLPRAQLAALGRAAHRDGASDPGGALARKVNGALGADGDLVLARVAPAPAGFDARFSAVWRRYRYRIADDLTTPDPLQRWRTTRVRAALDLDAMAAASAAAVGLHDFLSFCKPRPGATTIRTLQAFDWSREPDGAVVAELRADAFCHSMVRALVGAAVAVGAGRRDGPAIDAALASPSRVKTPTLAQAKGLTLVEVGYPSDDALAEQASRSRAKRVLAGGPVDPDGDEDGD